MARNEFKKGDIVRTTHPIRRKSDGRVVLDRRAVVTIDDIASRMYIVEYAPGRSIALCAEDIVLNSQPIYS